MTKIKLLGLSALITVLSAFTVSTSMDWNITDDYSIDFTSKDPTGSFNKLDGVIEFDENNLSDSKFDVKIDVASIDTGNRMKNRHAQGKKWFDAEQFPTINFTSDKITKSPAGYEVTGTLEMHGIAKEFTMPFTFENEVFQSSFTVNRTDFNIGATTGMAKKVPVEIQLDITVPVKK